MVYFVRHGNKVAGDFYNAELNILDEPLSERGQTDAHHIAEYFRDIEIRKIIVSRHLRTQQTARFVSEEKRLPLLIDERVDEINNGGIRYMTESEIKAAYPAFWENFSSRQRDVRYPNGESGGDVIKRQDSFLNELKSEQGNILVVTHEGFIRILLCNILGLPVYKRYKFKVAMGSVSAIEFDKTEQEWRLVLFNEIHW